MSPSAPPRLLSAAPQFVPATLSLAAPLRASLAPSLSPTAPTPSPAIGSLCRVAGFSEPLAQPGSRRLRSRRQRLRHRQQQLVRYAGLPGSANQLRSHRQQLIRYAGLPGSANQLCRLVRFESTALTYLATIPVYAATLPIRQMMPRPLARHQHIFLRQHDDFFFTTATTNGLNSSQQPSGCTSSPGRM